MYTKSAGWIIAGRNHTPAIRPATDSNWTVLQGRIIAHFNGSKKTIAVEMNNFSGSY
jgi:hypothetical protein